MTKQEITDKIFEFACNKFKLGKNEITSESTFNSFELNSIDIAVFIIEVEEHFKINIPDNIAFKFYITTSTTVMDFVDSFADYIYMTIINKN